MTSQDTVASPHENGSHDFEAILRPPASKRAVSTGAIGTSSASSRATSRSGSRSPSVQSGWEPGMALPPPPPGPPPSSSRSQSSNGIGDGYTRSTVGTISRGKVRQAPALGTSLGPVPPTPAGWTDNDATEDHGRSSGRQGPLHIDTQNVPRLTSPPIVTSMEPSELSANSSIQASASAQRRMSSGLSRTPALRDPSVKAIRERRSESRSGPGSSGEKGQEQLNQDGWTESPESIRPANLVLSNSRTSFPRRQTITRSTPRSGSFSAFPDDQPPSATLKLSSGVRSVEESSTHSTPKQGPDSSRRLFANSSPTPPISAGGEPCSPPLSRGVSPPQLPQKALPTPPLQHSRPPSSQSMLAPLSGQDRPVSHLLHLPNDASIPPPLSPRRPTIDTSVAEGSHKEDDNFVRDATERHRKFLAQERAARDDTERLRLFADYIIAESSIRRGRYSTAWDSGAINVGDCCKNLFSEPPEPLKRVSQDIAPPIEPPSPLSAVENPATRPETMWWNNYQPCLSPIASMSHNDEMSSRGRTPSRWWESQTGSGSAGRSSKIERSRRESKYMGVPLKEAMEGVRSSRDYPNLGAVVEKSGPLAVAGHDVYGPDEYPPEKQGWHEQEDETGPFVGGLSIQPPTPRSAALSTPELRLDISLFVTLPPPYPRHHPAISNSHPDLAKFRNHVRSVSDMGELTSRRARYKTNTEALRRSKTAKLGEDKEVFMTNLRAQITEGSVSFAEAAEAEEAFKHEQAAAEKDMAQSEFDEFQDVVMNPLRELLSPRIRRTDAIIQELNELLDEDARARNPDQTQAEGDERPELLETLTQLKWLFESREALHRELFLLEGQQNQLYEKVVIQPYLSQDGAEGKLQSTRSFFRRDEAERKKAFEREALKRFEALEKIVEETVDRGVEVQLSAFWDIAPNLLDLLNKLPADGNYSIPESGTRRAGQYRGIRIPPEEMIENPIYAKYPEQHLWSLLCHAEKSTYQFIESQVNLLCLQHEVRCGKSGAQCKAEEAALLPAEIDSPQAEKISNQSQQKRTALEKHLTNELQERVATVENLWRESLGSQMTGVKDRVKTWLVSRGGWEEDMDG